MGRKREDLTGQRFGRLIVISLNEEVGKQKGRAYWNCKCDCGNETVVRASHLISGNTTSCGCYNRDRVSDKMREMWQNEEYRQMQSELSSKRLKEKWQDEEYRQMQSDKMKEQNEKMWQDEEFRQMKSNKMIEQWKDKEFRKMRIDKAKEQMKELWEDEEFRQMKSDRTREQWQDEETRWKMGYKGGISLISKHLRKLPEVIQWRKDTYIREDNICQLTGKHVHGGNSSVHHLYGFNIIVLEAHELNNIQVKPQVKDYTEEELHKLEEYVASWHKDTSNAVLLSNEVHNLFHRSKKQGGYGYGDNTPEQFEEFRERYMAGEFKDLI